ncbi:MAG TPA: Flp pilus assembly protein CpaB [Marmoricola sp.]
MDRRKVLLIVAAVVAALGTLLVFLYVKGADTRADQRYHAVQVLKAVKPITPGETVADAQAQGAIELGTVAQQDQLPDALSDLSAVNGQVANTAIQPGEQITSSKFGSPAAGNALQIPKGKLAISISLTDPGRVAGFVNPGDDVAIFMSGSGQGNNAGTFTQLLLPKVEVIAVGTTTVTTTTTTDASGQQTTEQLPKTLMTLAVDQAEAQKVIYASGNGTLAFGLLNKDSKVATGKAVTDQNIFQ